MVDETLDAILVVETADLFWLGGTVQSAHLLLAATGDPRLLVRKVLERAREDSSLDDVRPLRSLKELPEQLRETCGAPPWRVGMELDVLPANTLRMYQRVLGADAEIVDASRALLACREVKSELEVEELRAGGRVHKELFACLPELFESAVSSYELQNRLDSRARSLGHCGVIRLRGLNVETGIGIVVSGEEGAIPSHSIFPIGGPGPSPWVAAGGSARPIAKNAPIIADYLISLGGYHADCTRMAVHGELPDGAAEILARMQEELRYCESVVRAGSIPSRIYEDVVGRVRDAGLGDGFMGPGDLAVKFIGHSVGLQVNETPVLAPRFDAPLEVGNTLAIEPKYTHPRFGVIGVENTYVVREDGLENLSCCPEDVVVIEG